MGGISRGFGEEVDFARSLGKRSRKWTGRVVLDAKLEMREGGAIRRAPGREGESDCDTEVEVRGTAGARLARPRLRLFCLGSDRCPAMGPRDLLDHWTAICPLASPTVGGRNGGLGTEKGTGSTTRQHVTPPLLPSLEVGGRD